MENINQPRIYIARLKDRTLTEKIRRYLKNQEIDIIKFHEHIGLITLKSNKDLSAMNIKYIEDIEPETPYHKS